MKDISKTVVAEKIQNPKYELDCLFSRASELGHMNHESMSVTRVETMWPRPYRVDIYVHTTIDKVSTSTCVGRFNRQEAIAYLRGFTSAWEMSRDASRRWFQKDGNK